MAGFAPVFSFVLLNSLWQGGLLAFCAALTLRAMAQASARARHAVAMWFLILMAAASVAQVAIYANADAILSPAPLGEVFGAQPLAALLMIAAWTAGIVFMLARRGVGRAMIAAMERAPHTEPARALVERAEQIRVAMGVAAPVALRVSDAVATPCVTGGLRPIVWLPAALLVRLPVEQLQALVLHEFAHIARRDWLCSAVQNVIQTLLFYHPAVWWLSKRVRQEREHACDDLAIATGADAIVLAEALARLEETRPRAATLAIAANGGSLVHRVARLVCEPRSPRGAGVPALLGAIAIAGALIMGQIGVGGGHPLDLVVESSTASELGAGDYRQITAHEGAIERFYRASVDARGRVTEIYRVDGRTRPIDPAVRRWLDTVLH